MGDQAETAPKTAETVSPPAETVTPTAETVRPPVAKRVPVERTRHGETVVDEYAWLADPNDPDTVAYLVAENEFTAARTADQEPLRQTIFNEIKRRTQETDLSVPVRKGQYWYYTRTVEGKQYGIYCRRRVAEGETAPPVTEGGGPLPGEEVLLDGNVEAGQSPFFALGTFDVSPDGNLLAYSVDLDGDERFTLRIKDLRTGEVLPDEITDTFYGAAWSADASTVFYLTVDEAWRPYQVWRHQVGTSREADVLVLEERDQRFSAGVELSRSEQYICISLHSQVTSEVHVVPAATPSAAPRLVAARRHGIEYSIEHDPHGDAPGGAGRFLIVHNDGAEDFAVAWTPAADPGAWHPLIPPTPGTRILGADAFAGHVVISLRRDGLTRLRVLPRTGEQHEIEFPESIYTVGLDANPEYDTAFLRLHYTSLVTPMSVYDYIVDTRELVLRKQQPVLGGFNPADYEQHREWATAPDGTRIPISLVCRAGTVRDGHRPTVLYGYGAYEFSLDPFFSVARLSLLDRGVVFAIAHVRGGGELGRSWYNHGKLAKKKNTFTDFVACAQHLVAAGWTSPQHLVARGGSAGGLLMGAVANLAPTAFAGIVAEVPFVDALNTILNPDLPLTVAEWEEWGNPVEDAEAYAYIRSYAPYENVAAQRYPAILALGSRNDTRVLYHEPAKWIARLRAVAPEGDYLLKTQLDAGHGGPSGRYDAWREEAFTLAWIVTRLGLA